jgi:hypothetical protein
MSLRKNLIAVLLALIFCFAGVFYSCKEIPRDNSFSGTQSKSDYVAATEPLKVHPSNPRYFTDGTGKPIYLTGSHSWFNLQDGGYTNPPPVFDYTGYLAFMQAYNHNFMRMWVWENAWGTVEGARKFYHSPLPYERKGPGLALDGAPKFNLKQFNQAYFDRLRQRVIAARNQGIYVSIMLFQGWSIQKKKRSPWNLWLGHPFNRNNNVNGINGDLNGDGNGEECHTLLEATIIALQEAYVRKVVDTVNGLENVLYEISNEEPATSENTKWQYHIINYIHSYEISKFKQHPVGMTVQFPGGSNSVVFASPADWVSPKDEGAYRDNPPAADRSKVIISDTDHLGPVQPSWVWKSFLRGLNPILMDWYGKSSPWYSDADQETMRRYMGYTLTYANKMNLASMVPRNDLASTKYCLANPGKEYLIYLPLGWNEMVVVDLSGSLGELQLEWFNPRTGKTTDGGTTKGGERRSFRSPFPGDAVLYIQGP